MDILKIQIKNIMSELANEADKSIHDSSVLYTLLHHAVKIFDYSLININQLESKIDNLEAEVQRLNQLSRY